MNRETYLSDLEVQGFVKWMSKFTSGEWQFSQNSGNRASFSANERVSLHEAYEQYEWKANARRVDGRGVTVKTFKENTELLDEYRYVLRSAMSEGYCSAGAHRDFLRVAHLVLEWGGINHLKRLDNLGYGALEVLTRAAKKLNPEYATTEGLNGFEYMGSGFSKIYSLMIDDFPIYDSRVACALTSLICLFCEYTGLACVPEELRLGVPPSKGGRLNNPSRGTFSFPNIRGAQHSLYAKSNLRAAWLLQELAADATAGEFLNLSEFRRVRAIEAALFMVGHEPLLPDAIVRG